ncbi:hypothetical protein LXL04_033078 [Taraxacum kok-saghyz]
MAISRNKPISTQAMKRSDRYKRDEIQRRWKEYVKKTTTMKLIRLSGGGRNTHMNINRCRLQASVLRDPTCRPQYTFVNLWNLKKPVKTDNETFARSLRDIDPNHPLLRLTSLSPAHQIQSGASTPSRRLSSGLLRYRRRQQHHRRSSNPSLPDVACVQFFRQPSSYFVDLCSTNTGNIDKEYRDEVIDEKLPSVHERENWWQTADVWSTSSAAEAILGSRRSTIPNQVVKIEYPFDSALSDDDHFIEMMYAHYTEELDDEVAFDSASSEIFLDDIDDDLGDVLRTRAATANRDRVATHGRLYRDYFADDCPISESDDVPDKVFENEKVPDSEFENDDNYDDVVDDDD